jgi:hypothetical protein
MSEPPDVPPIPDPPKPLEYFHSTEQAPLHPLLLMLCALAGFIVGGGVMIAVGGGCLAGVLNMGNGGQDKLRFAGVAAIFGAVGIFIALAFKFRRDRALTFVHRQRGGRFFFIGFIIGCGVCCLLEGICFSGFGSN